MSFSLLNKLHPGNKDKLFDELVQRHYNNIFKFCYYRLSQDRYTAEDCTQEVFIILYKNMSRLENFEKMDGWLYKTADHLIKRANAKAAREKKKVESIDADDSHPIPAAMIYEECYDLLESTEVDMGKCLKEVFESLTETETEIWNLYYRQRKSLREVSEATELSESAVKSRVSRLKRKIIVLTHEVFEKNS